MQPDMIPVTSSNIKAIGHDPAAEELHVEFGNGAKHIYSSVSVQQFEGLKGASSVGTHLHANIKPYHTSRKA